MSVANGGPPAPPVPSYAGPATRTPAFAIYAAPTNVVIWGPAVKVPRRPPRAVATPRQEVHR